jgi:hypothetical protein
MVAAAIAGHSRLLRVASTSEEREREGGTSASCNSLPMAPAQTRPSSGGVACCHNDPRLLCNDELKASSGVVRGCSAPYRADIHDNEEEKRGVLLKLFGCRTI